MKRIAIIVHGGVAPPGSKLKVPAIEGLVEQLSERFDITVYTGFSPDGHRGSFLCGKATVHYFPFPEGNALATFVPQALRAFRKEHRLRPFSLVHGLWALPGGLAAVLAGKVVGIQSVVSLLGGEATSIPDCKYGNMRQSSTRHLTFWVLRHAKSITMLTRYQLDQLRRFGFTRTADVNVIPFGADPKTFPYVRQKPPFPPYHLLHIGHLNRVKDQRTLLKAFQKISLELDCHLHIIGEGSQDGELRRLAGELGVADRVAFLGFVPHHDLHEHFAWAHLLLHTSLYEGQGVVFSEAAASGVPVCGTRVGLLSDLGEQFAASVDPGDHAALAKVVCELLGDEVRLESLRSWAHAWADEHTVRGSAERFAELYTQITEKPSVESSMGDFPSFACPSCHQSLVVEATGWHCVDEGLRFPTREGFADFLLPARREIVVEFLRTYQQVRRAEGWGGTSAEYYRELPYRDLSRKHGPVWHIRARTFEAFMRHFSRLVGQRRVRCLDLGAGNCWFAAKVAERGHSVVALDVNLDREDGLGAISHFPVSQRRNVLPVRAEFDALPFSPGSFDVVVFNASIHYSSDINRTFAGAMNVLKDQGVLYIIDSPVYGSMEAGEQMIQEQRMSFAALLGDALPERRAMGFLTESMLREMSARYRMEVLYPAYGLRWAMRPKVARLLGRREPATFKIIAFRKHRAGT